MRVDFDNNDWDRDVRVYGEMGKSTKFIIAHTGLTKCQVQYRITAALVNRRAARDGESKVSKLVDKEVYSIVASYFLKKPGG